MISAKTIRLHNAAWLSDYRVELRFDGNVVRQIDFGTFLSKHLHPQRDRYRKPSNFRKFKIERNNLVWRKIGAWNLTCGSSIKGKPCIENNRKVPPHARLGRAVAALACGLYLLLFAGCHGARFKQYIISDANDDDVESALVILTNAAQVTSLSNMTVNPRIANSLACYEEKPDERVLGYVHLNAWMGSGGLFIEYSEGYPGPLTPSRTYRTLDGILFLELHKVFQGRLVIYREWKDRIPCPEPPKDSYRYKPRGQ